jgi:hypothetical protein
MAYSCEVINPSSHRNDLKNNLILFTVHLTVTILLKIYNFFNIWDQCYDHYIFLTIFTNFLKKTSLLRESQYYDHFSAQIAVCNLSQNYHVIKFFRRKYWTLLTLGAGGFVLIKCVCSCGTWTQSYQTRFSQFTLVICKLLVCFYEIKRLWQKIWWRMEL